MKVVANVTLTKSDIEEALQQYVTNRLEEEGRDYPEPDTVTFERWTGGVPEEATLSYIEYDDEGD